jgi:protein Hikeshi
MFGLIISGRPVDAAPQAITEAQYAFRIPPTPAFSHIVVFILPGAQLPPGMAASVYIQIPPSQEFKLLGGIGPGKESAIFKVSGLKPGAQANTVGGVDADMDAMTDDPAAGLPTNGAGAATPTAMGDIVVGVSIEPAAQVETQLAALRNGKQQQPGALVRFNSTQGGRVATKVLAQRIIGNAFNFLASFGSDTVPLKAFQDWWAKFEKKVELDPTFLEKEEMG